MGNNPTTMATRIIAKKGNLLPIGLVALELDGRPERTSFYDNVQSWFEQFGIVIGDETDISGWHECQLPNGWRAERYKTGIYYKSKAGILYDDEVRFRAPNGGWFDICMSKDPAVRTAVISYTSKSVEDAKRHRLMSLCGEGSVDDPKIVELMIENNLRLTDRFLITGEPGEFYFDVIVRGFHLYKADFGYYDMFLGELADGKKTISRHQ